MLVLLVALILLSALRGFTRFRIQVQISIFDFSSFYKAHFGGIWQDFYDSKEHTGQV